MRNKIRFLSILTLSLLCVSLLSPSLLFAATNDTAPMEKGTSFQFIYEDNSSNDNITPDSQFGKGNLSPKTGDDFFYPSDVIVFLLHISWGTGNQPCAQKHPSSKTIKKHRFLRQCSSKQYKIVFGKWRSLRAMPFDLLILINLVVLFFYNFSLLSSPQTSRYCHQLVKSLPHVQYILFIRPQS